MTENFVDISGVTVRSPDVYAEAGIAFFNTSGRITNSVVGPLYHAADATELAARPHGWGIVMTNSLQGASEATVRREVTISNSLVTGYQAGGVLFDDSRGADGNADDADALRDRRVRDDHRLADRGRRPERRSSPQTGVQYHAGARGAVTGSEIVNNMLHARPAQVGGRAADRRDDRRRPVQPGGAGVQRHQQRVERQRLRAVQRRHRQQRGPPRRPGAGHRQRRARTGTAARPARSSAPRRRAAATASPASTRRPRRRSRSAPPPARPRPRR